MNPLPAASPRWIRAAGWILLAKLIYLGTVFTVLKLWNHPESIPKFEVRWPIDAEPTFESHFATWDAAHYLLLATQGYAEGVRSCAFYPLWPLLWRGVIALGAPPVWGGLVLANLLSTLGLALVYRAVALRHDASRAFWVVLFMAVHPGNVFLQFSYSECVFLVLLVSLWSGLEEHRWWPAAFGALLLPLSRAIGVFAMLPIGVWLLRHPVIAPVWNRCVFRAPGSRTVCWPSRRTRRVAAVDGWLSWRCRSSDGLPTWGSWPTGQATPSKASWRRRPGAGIPSSTWSTCPSSSSNTSARATSTSSPTRCSTGCAS